MEVSNNWCSVCNGNWVSPCVSLGAEWVCHDCIYEAAEAMGLFDEQLNLQLHSALEAVAVPAEQGA